MSVRVCQNSFSKGVISPSLDCRVDLEQYSLGLKKLENGIILQEGCVQNRAGLEFLQKAKYSDKKCRLIPFIFDLEQNYILEFGEEYIRIIKDGGYVLDNNNQIYEITTPYQESDLFEIDYVQQADTITLVHKNYSPYELSRINHDNWQLNSISFSATIAAPTNVSATYTGSTSSNTTYYYYVVTAVRNSSNEESTRSEKARVLGHLEAYWTTSEYITITWNAVNNAQEYNVYRAVNGIYGYIGSTSNTRFIDNNIEPDLTSCAPIYSNPFRNNENPSCVCYYQQRKVYASSANSPQKFWASQTGTNNNFNISRPLNATDSITMSLYDNVANSIQHLIPLNDLIVMSTNAEWAVNGNDGVFSANPAPGASIQSYYGSSKIKPIISGSMVIFVQLGGNIVRDLGYNYLSDSYDGSELTILANHLFEGKQILDMAYSKEPNRIIWCVMSDGTVNALTYNPSQKISAWHNHTTKGDFESVATIREGNEDNVYFVVKRKINNQTVRYIERMKSRTIKTLENGFFLDSALSSDFDTYVTTVSGFEHLKGETINALLDFGVVENLVVDQNGTVTLPYPAKHIVAGIPYTFELQTLNIENIGTIGIKKVINKVDVKILNSREDFFIKNDDATLCQNARSHDSINNPQKLYSKNTEFTVLNSPEIEKNITIIQKYPLPLTISAICTTISLEGSENS